MKRWHSIKIIILIQFGLLALLSRCQSPYLFALLIIAFSLTVRLLFWLSGFKWIRLSLVIIFVGGIMVLFIYVSSLAAQSKLLLPLNSGTLFFGGTLATWSLFFLPFSFNPNLNSSSLLFLTPQNFPLLALLFYLLALLLFVVKFLENFKGSFTEKF